MIKVRATQPGFYQKLYKKGEVFRVPQAAFSEEWMEKVKSDDKKPDDEKRGPGRPKKE